jgi:hypothetical protein
LTRKIHVLVLIPLLALSILVTLVGGTGWAMERKDGAEYVIEGNETVTVGWDAATGVGAYEIRLLMLYVTPLTYFALARVPASETTVTLAQPRAGHFQVEARACRYSDCHVDDLQNPQNDLSTWVVSTDPTIGIVDGVHMAWWIYWKLAKFTGPVIE